MALSVEEWAEGRRLFEAGVPTAMIAEQLGVVPATVHTRARNGDWKRPLDWEALGRGMATGGGRRKRMVARLYSAFEKQVLDLEARMADLDGREADDRDARTLATLAQTLDRLVTLDTGAKPGTRASQSDSSQMKITEKAGGDKTGPDKTGGEEEPDIDEFRRDLARRLEALGAGRHREASGQPEPAPDGTLLP